MAPFKPGDYITYSGIRVGGETICYSITAESVQILTANGAPAYIRMEDAIIGVVDGQPAANAEFADTRVRTRANALLVPIPELTPAVHRLHQ